VPENSYGKERRLLSKNDFLYLRSKSRRTSARNVIVYYKKSQTGSSLTRLGISVSKKVGCAVKRNRLKRIIREFFRTSTFGHTGKDILVVVSPHLLKEGDYQKIGTYLRKVMNDLFLRVEHDCN
jgi:ribonuclease P protein component